MTEEPLSPAAAAEKADLAGEAPSLTGGDANVALSAYLGAHGGVLFKKDNSFRVRISGEALLDGTPVPFCLVPPEGWLMKAGKWRTATAQQRLALIRERIDRTRVAAMVERVERFLMQARALAEELELQPNAFWPALVTDGADEQARFATILDRMRAAYLRRRESLSAEKVRAAIRLTEYPETFPAVKLPRRFVALLGPTNSGKTHHAMRALEAAASGVYLAPLRLLANENYERLERAGVAASLITGEERKLHPQATHFASTVEMLDPYRLVDVAAIDEVQMLEDPERGSAWTAAVCGVPAQTVYLVGSPTAEPALHALAARLGVPLSVERLERKSPLEIEPWALGGLGALRPGDALIAFSRREVLYLAQQLSAMGRSVATIYGALSPEARRAQARRFESGEASIVVATDAIGMGLNLPISRVVFTTVSKFDGYEEDLVPRALLHQIAGRAGRYGLHEAGRVCALEEPAHRHLRRELSKAPAPLRTSRFEVSPTLEHLRALQEATGEHALERLLQRFVRDLDLQDDFFIPAGLAEQSARAPLLDRTGLSLEDRVMLSLVPINSEIFALETAWRSWVWAMARSEASRLRQPRSPERLDLQQAEDASRLCAAYSWLSYRRPELFPDGTHARAFAAQLSAHIDLLLAHRHAGNSGVVRPQRRVRRGPGGRRGW